MCACMCMCECVCARVYVCACVCMSACVCVRVCEFMSMYYVLHGSIFIIYCMPILIFFFLKILSADSPNVKRGTYILP